jgi:hypothetical protein
MDAGLLNALDGAVASEGREVINIFTFVQIYPRILNKRYCLELLLLSCCLEYGSLSQTTYKDDFPIMLNNSSSLFHRKECLSVLKK